MLISWVIVGVLFVALLALDILIARRGHGALRSAIYWSVGWFAIGLAFTGAVIALEGQQSGEEYLVGYLIERSLSLDNVFVFLVLLQALAIPAYLHERVIQYGVLLAIVLRLGFIAIGAALLALFAWTLYLFGAILVLTALKFLRHSDAEVEPERSLMLRGLRKVMPIGNTCEGNKLTIIEQGKRVGTPLLAALVLVAGFDLVFAIDSIPAIFAITDDPFVVFAANAFALLGLRPLYVVLADSAERFRYLHYGLAAILAWVGAKMLLHDVVHIDPLLSLVVIVVALAAAIGASWIGDRHVTPGPAGHAPAPPPAGPAPDDPTAPPSPARGSDPDPAPAPADRTRRS